MTNPSFLIMSDFDGVIADSERAYFNQMADILRDELGMDLDNQAFRQRLSGHSGGDAYDIILDMLEDDNKGKFPQVWRDIITPIHDNREITTIDGMKDLYQDLADAPEVLLSTVSNSGHDELHVKVDKLDLRSIFQQAVHSFEDSPSRKPKPSPAPYEFGAAVHGFVIGKDNVVVIEDSVPGAQAGIAVGAYTIGFIDTTERSDESIEQCRDALLNEAGVDEVCIGADELRATLESKFGISLGAHHDLGLNNPANDIIQPDEPMAFG